MEKQPNLILSFKKGKFSDISIIEVFNTLLTYLISAILLFSGFLKFIDPTILIDSLLQQLAFLLPQKVLNHLVILIATILPITEIGLGLLLIFSIHHNLIKIKRRLLLFVVVSLFCLFFLYSLYGFWIDLKGDCGCFGNIISSNFDAGMIIRNFIFLFLAVTNLKYSNRY